MGARQFRRGGPAASEKVAGRCRNAQGQSSHRSTKGRSRVLGWARCNGALLVILEYADGSRLPATLIREQGRWKRTNALSAERTFDIVFAAVRERGTLTRTAPGKTGKK